MATELKVISVPKKVRSALPKTPIERIFEKCVGRKMSETESRILLQESVVKVKT